MKRIFAALLPCLGVGILALCLVCCHGGDVSTNSQAAAQSSGGPDDQGTRQDNAPAPVASVHPPMSNSATDEPLEVKPVKEAQAAYDKAKKSHLSAPKDEASTKTYVAAANTLADSTMMGDGAPNVKYPAALSLYREVLKADASNNHAQKEIKQMEDIYASLGKPVPGGK